MLLEVSKVSDVSAPSEAAWALVRDVPRLSGCIPNVSNLETLEADRRYSAVVAEKLGPFKLQVPVLIDLQRADEDHSISAELTGNDSKGQARVKGTLEASVEAIPEGSRLAFNMRMEVLGKLAALGAAPMRRRADDIFKDFVGRVRTELGASEVGS